MKNALLIIFLALNTCLIYSQTIYMKVNKNDGTCQYYPVQDIRKITFSGLAGINDPENMLNVIRTFNMLRNYPNPFNTGTTIEYELPDHGTVEISIFDITGKRITNISNENQTSGKHCFYWDCKNNSGESVKSGIYTCQLKFIPSGSQGKSQFLNNKMILVK